MLFLPLGGGDNKYPANCTINRVYWSCVASTGDIPRALQSTFMLMSVVVSTAVLIRLIMFLIRVI